MHETKPHSNNVTVFHRECGKLHTFKDLDQAAKYLGWIQSLGTIGDHFVRTELNVAGIYSKVWYDVILRDDNDEGITEGQLIACWRDLYKKRKNRWFNSGVKHRHPGRKRRWHRGSYYRCIKTLNERKWTHAWDDEEYAPKVRARRNKNNLPNSWVDYRRNSVDDHKNWKHHRKHQWKETK